MRTLNYEEIQQVSGAGVLAQEFGNAGLGFGSAADHIIHGGTLSQIGNGLGFGIGSVGDGLLGASGQVGNFAVGATAELAPPLISTTISSTGDATAAVLGAGISATGDAVGSAFGQIAGSVIGALNPLHIG